MSTSKRILFALALFCLLAATLVVLLKPELLKPAVAPAEAPVSASDDKAAAQAQRDQATQHAGSTKPVMTVTVETPRNTWIPIRLPVDGDIAPWEEATVASEVNGQRIVEVLVNVGDSVEKGQPLARFSEQNAQAEVTRAQASLAEARAALSEANSNVQRATRLRKTGVVSRQKLIEYRVAAQTARARVRSARAALKAQQENHGFTTLRAPDDGLISARSATVGSVPASGSQLFKLIRQGRLEWRAEVMASDLERISVGDQAEIHTGTNRPTRAWVRALSPSVDTRTRTALVYVDLPPGTPARAGMFLGGHLLLGQKSAMTVSLQSVVPRDGFNYIYRLGKEGRVQRMKVVTGVIDGDRVEIRATPPAQLRDTDQVVVQGAGFLSDGDPVAVAEPDTVGHAPSAGFPDVIASRIR